MSGFRHGNSPSGLTCSASPKPGKVMPGSGDFRIPARRELCFSAPGRRRGQRGCPHEVAVLGGPARPCIWGMSDVVGVAAGSAVLERAAARGFERALEAFGLTEGLASAVRAAELVRQAAGVVAAVHDRVFAVERDLVALGRPCVSVAGEQPPLDPAVALPALAGLVEALASAPWPCLVAPPGAEGLTSVEPEDLIDRDVVVRHLDAVLYLAGESFRMGEVVLPPAVASAMIALGFGGLPVVASDPVWCRRPSWDGETLRLDVPLARLELLGEHLMRLSHDVADRDVYDRISALVPSLLIVSAQRPWAVVCEDARVHGFSLAETVRRMRAILDQVEEIWMVLLPHLGVLRAGLSELADRSVGE